MHLVRRLALFFVLFIGFGGAAVANPLLLVDMDSAEVLYEQDAGQPWYPASLTKLMTAFVAFEAIADGRATLDTPVILSRHAINQAPSKSGLPVDSALSLQDALYVLIVKSANDVAVAIAETISGSEPAFVAQMNASAARLGMTATHFVNANGLHAAGQVTTARDLAILSLVIHKNFPQYQPIFETEVVTLGKASLESNNNLLTEFAGTTGMKTGYICASGLNIVATANRHGRSLMAVLLGGASTRERGEMTAELFLRGYSGALHGTGKSILQVANLNQPPVDMRAQLCGKQAKAYVAERETAYPMGLKGRPSYLTDQISGRSYAAVNLGRVRNVPVPRPRPAYAPAATLPPAAIALVSNSPSGIASYASGAPIPMPRPSR